MKNMLLSPLACLELVDLSKAKNTLHEDFDRLDKLRHLETRMVATYNVCMNIRPSVAIGDSFPVSRV